MSMHPGDVLQFSLQSILRQGFRSAMVLLSMAIGVASVVVLTAVGEGGRSYVNEQFAFLGRDMLVVFPGRKETTGALPPVTGSAARDITLDDVHQLQQRLPGLVLEVAPVVIGSAEVSFRQLARETVIMGTSHSFVSMRQLTLAQGRNFSGDTLQAASNECVIGETTRDELFPNQSPLGMLLRVADYRCRVVGVLAGRGDAMGMNLSDAVLMPVAASQRLFNTQGLFRLMIRIPADTQVEQAKRRVAAVMAELHQGIEDVTVVSPDALLATFDQVLGMLTLAVGAIAGISLLVAGVLIMNVTLIGISQRTGEIGLLKALGASSRQILWLLLSETLMVALVGIVLGIAVASALVHLLAAGFPAIPFTVPVWATGIAGLVALVTATGFAWKPVTRASRLEPLTALQHP